MHVALKRGTTWRGPGLETLFARHEIAALAISLYRRTVAPHLLKGLRALGPRWVTRFEKARSATQSPSAKERHFEDVIVEFVAGATPAELREDAEALHTLIDAISQSPSATDADVLVALRVDDEAEARVRAAETRLTTRIDRRLEIPDLEALRDATRTRAAAAREQLSHVDRLLTCKRRARHGLTVTNGGLT